MSDDPAGAIAIRIRPAGVLDVPLLAALHALIFPEEPWDAAVWVTQLALAETRILLATEADPGGVPLGLLAGRQVVDEAEILTIGTAPAAQRRGVATALLKAYCAGLVADGVVALFLEVAHDNHGAQRFYREQQFHQVGERRDYYVRPGGVCVSARVLRRNLG